GLSVTNKPLRRASFTPWLAGLASVLLALNLWQDLDREAPAETAANPYAGAGLWQPLLDDELPVLVLVGDYYIMGEVDAQGNVLRMVREFSINSPRDLQTMQAGGRGHEYFNLDLSYTPTS